MKKFLKEFKDFKKRAEENHWGSRSNKWFQRTIKLQSMLDYTSSLAEQITLCRIMLTYNKSFDSESFE